MRAWLTPETIPVERACRALSIPNDVQILGAVTGALLPLTRSENWEKHGAVDPDAIAYAMLDMLLQFFDGTCGTLSLPGGYPPTRLNSQGEIEQLIDGLWQSPTGEYAIPPVAPREETTEIERKCTAVVNAVHVLALLYEQLTDDYAAGLTDAQIILNFASAAAAVIGAWFTPLVLPLIALNALLWNVIIETLEFISMDLWTSQFDDKMKCALYECASDNAGVITIDFTCAVERLSNAVNLFDPSFAEIRLFGQIVFMMNFIGQEALNHAGSTTGVSPGETCGECVDPECFVLQVFMNGNGGYTITRGVQENDHARSTRIGNVMQVNVEIAIDPGCVVKEFRGRMLQYHPLISGSVSMGFAIYGSAHNLIASTNFGAGTVQRPVNTPFVDVWNANVAGSYAEISMAWNTTSFGVGYAHVYEIEIIYE